MTRRSKGENFQRSNGLDFGIWLAIEEIWKSDAVRVDVDRKHLDKYGANFDLDSGDGRVPIWQIGLEENYLTDNLIDTASSSHADDDQLMYYEGMTLNNDVFSFGFNQFTLDGQNKVTLGTPMARTSRARNLSGTPLQGDVYLYEDTAISGGVPSDLTKVHAQVATGEEQTLKAATTISHANYFLLYNMWAGIARSASARVIIELRVRPYGGVFTTKYRRSVSQDGPLDKDWLVPLIIPPGCDIEITSEVEGSTNNIDVSAGFSGVFADIMTT